MSDTSCLLKELNPYPANTESDLSATSRARLYTVGWPTSSSHLDIPKSDNGKCQKCKVDYSI